MQYHIDILKKYINWPNPLCNKLSVYTGGATEGIVTTASGTSGTVSSSGDPSVW